MSSKRKIVIAADWLKNSDTDWWFYSNVVELNKGATEVVLIGNGKLYNQKDRNSTFGHIVYLLKNIVFSFKLIFSSRNGDIIFCWNQLPGLSIAVISRLFHLQRIVVCQNFLYRSSKSKYFDIFRNSIYNYALGYGKTFVSVQGPDLLAYYADHGLNFKNERFYFVPDCIPDGRVPEHIIRESRKTGEDYIFTGGEANRDWELVMKIAQSLPHYKFRCVARKRFFDHNLSIPDNVKIYWDTSLNEYFTLLAKSKICLIPIKEVYNPAGLLLLFDSITLGKVPVATHTPFISAYLEEYSNCLCFKNVDEAIDRISKLYFSTELSQLPKSLNRKARSITPELFVSKHLDKLYRISDIL